MVCNKIIKKNKVNNKMKNIKNNNRYHTWMKMDSSFRIMLWKCPLMNNSIILKKKIIKSRNNRWRRIFLAI